MTTKPTKDASPPDPYKRIEELEGQVSELSHLVEQLAARVDEGAHLHDSPPEEAPEVAVEEHRSLVSGARGALTRVLGGEAGETLESRIGGIWLSRIAAVLFMTALVLGGAMALRDQVLFSGHKLAIGYTFAAAGIAYGLMTKRKENLFAQTALGCGLAILYFTTYAAFFIDETQIFKPGLEALPFLGACLVALVVIAHLKRSLTVAGIGLFLIYYTVVLGLNESTSYENVLYALVTCSMISVVALVFHVTHRWFMFTWAALIGGYGVYLYFFVVRHPTLDLAPEAYFWVTSAFLTLTFLLFATAIVTDAGRRNEYRKGVGPMVGFNSFLYFAMMWLDIRAVYADTEWAFRLGFTAMLVVLALYAETVGPRRNYLFQIFIAKAVIMFTLAMQAYLSHEWLYVAMALECIALGISYLRSGVVVFKVLGLGLLAVTFAGCMFIVRTPGELYFGGWAVQARWFTCVAVPVVFSFVACFYEHFVPHVTPEKRIEPMQWFLADTFLDLRSHSVALLHAVAGVIILLAITIVDLGDNPQLPYILAGECLVMLIVGYLIRTPQVEVASVMLLIAAHASFHIFLLFDVPGFKSQDYFAAFTVGIAVLTFFGGYLWEHYLARFKTSSILEHEAIVSIPYIAGALMLTTLIERVVEPVYSPALQSALAAALAVAAALFGLTGFAISALTAILLAIASFYIGLYTIDASTMKHADFLWTFGVFLASFVVTERAARAGSRHTPGEYAGAMARSFLVSVAAVLGILGLYEWAPKTQLIYYWIGLAIVSMAVGVIARESRYRWAALAIYFVAIVRAYLFDLTQLTPFLRFLSFAALCIPLLVISWGYSQYRLRALRRPALPSEKDSASDGPPA